MDSADYDATNEEEDPLNPADILSKHWGYSQIWPTLRPVLFWMGDTAELLDERHTKGTPPVNK